jgi:hypothetical protein
MLSEKKETKKEKKYRKVKKEKAKIRYKDKSETKNISLTFVNVNK